MTQQSYVTVRSSVYALSFENCEHSLTTINENGLYYTEPIAFVGQEQTSRISSISIESK